jgi:hypothetical protein
MGAITHTRVDHEVVRPSMDGLALNDWQALALHNPATPEVDSLLEHIEALTAHGVPAEIVEGLRSGVWLVAELNGRERQCQRQVAGNGERLVQELRPAERRQSLNRSELRRRLRPILDVLGDPAADPMAYVRAGRDFAAVEREVPVETLLSRSLAHELGQTGAEILRRLLGTAA